MTDDRGGTGLETLIGRVGSCRLEVRAIARTNEWRWTRVEDDLYRRERPKAIRRPGEVL